MSREDVLNRCGQILYHKEGIAATVTVRKQGSELFLQANGKTEASTGPDMRTQKLLAHVPMMLHPDPKSVIVIGLASGVTVGSAATYPVERIDCVEIAPAMVEVARTFFADANGHVLDDPRVSVILEDGRNHIAFTDRTYDVIISEPPNPWISGVSNLFTREFFELSKARTNPGGVVGVWFQAYNMSPDEFRMIARTFADVFEHASLWELDPSVDYMFVGTVGGAPTAEYATAAARLADPAIGGDLASVRVRTTARLDRALRHGRRRARRVRGPRADPHRRRHAARVLDPPAHVRTVEGRAAAGPRRLQDRPRRAPRGDSA